MVLAVQFWGQKRRFKRIYGKDTSKPTFHSRVCLVSDPKMTDAGFLSEVFKRPETLRAPIVGLPPATLRYGLADVPCRRTKVRRNLVELFLAVTLMPLNQRKFSHP